MGDNLAAHISEDVIKRCKENNIRFVCLHPNSTDKTQPLDVAYFAPLKSAWRNILNEWKKSPQGRIHPTLPKSKFPALLKKLVLFLEDNNGANNLVSGFRKCGIHPLDRNQVLKRLPGQGQVSPDTSVSSIDGAFVSLLSDIRGSNQAKKCPVASKRNRLNVVPGRAAGAASSDESNCSEPDENDSSSESVDSATLCDDRSDDPTDEDSVSETEETFTFEVGMWVIVKYDDIIYPGEVTALVDSDGKEAEVSCLTKYGKSTSGQQYWRWPNVVDKAFYKQESIQCIITPPDPVGNRGHLKFPDCPALL